MITSSGSVSSAGGIENTGSAGIILSLVATRNIEYGEVLRMDVQDSTNAREVDLLYGALKSTGQPIPHHIQMRHEHEVRACLLAYKFYEMGMGWLTKKV